MGFAPAALALGGIGAVTSAVGAYDKGEASAEAATYQSQVAANNALIARQNENMAAASGAAREAAQGMNTRQTVGNTKAAQGAGGVDVNTGSTAAVRSAESELGMLDTLTIRSNTAREAYGYEVKAASDTAQSQLDTFEAAADKQGGELSALGTFLNGASSVGGKFATLQLGGGA